MRENKNSALTNVDSFDRFNPNKLRTLIDGWNKYNKTKRFWSNWQVNKINFKKFHFQLYIKFKLGNHDLPRVATRIGKENVKLANALCLLIGGTPFTYYGEEIGMEDLDYDSISFEQCQDAFGKTFGVFLKCFFFFIYN